MRDNVARTLARGRACGSRTPESHAVSGHGTEHARMAHAAGGAIGFVDAGWSGCGRTGNEGSPGETPETPRLPYLLWRSRALKDAGPYPSRRSATLT